LKKYNQYGCYRQYNFKNLQKEREEFEIQVVFEVKNSRNFKNTIINEFGFEILIRV